MFNVLKRFNPFYFPRNALYWQEKKYITLNTFKGYSLFDFHFWSPQDRYFSHGSENNSKRICMIGATILYFRVELFFEWGHKGNCWR